VPRTVLSIVVSFLNVQGTHLDNFRQDDNLFIDGHNQKGPIMSKSNAQRVTGKKAASAAAKVLGNPKSTKIEKSAAASALAQRPGKKGK
jgi:hypothetical protein